MPLQDLKETKAKRTHLNETFSEGDTICVCRGTLIYRDALHYDESDVKCRGKNTTSLVNSNHIYHRWRFSK
jgi:hypothetical protein